MTGKSFAWMVLLCLVFLTIVLWQFEVNYFPGVKVSTQWNQTNESVRATVSHMESIQTKPWLIIFWSTVFGKQQNIQLAWNQSECPVACEVTSDRSRASNASGFIVHARDSHMTPSIKTVPWILFTQENPVYTPVLTNPSFMSKFQLLMSYRLDSDFALPVYPMPKLTPPLPFKEKDGLIMAVFSNCEPVRTGYMKQLMKFVPVDSYGACLKNKEGLVGRYGSADGKDFKQLKTQLAKKYRFTLVFFNQDCDYFVDDQLSHALNVGSVPVVMSTDKLDEFLPGNLRHSVIKVRDYKSPQQLAEYLKFLNTNETEYNKYLEWKWKGIGNFTGTVIGDYWTPKYPTYCQICVALAEGKVHKDGLQPMTCKSRSFKDWGI